MNAFLDIASFIMLKSAKNRYFQEFFFRMMIIITQHSVIKMAMNLNQMMVIITQSLVMEMTMSLNQMMVIITQHLVIKMAMNLNQMMVIITQYLVIKMAMNLNQMMIIITQDLVINLRYMSQSGIREAHICKPAGIQIQITNYAMKNTMELSN